MTPKLLDVVVLTRDLPAHDLRRGDLGAVVDLRGPEAFLVEFVAASGRTQALVTLRPADVRAVADDSRDSEPEEHRNMNDCGHHFCRH